MNLYYIYYIIVFALVEILFLYMNYESLIILFQ
jgi:hypothetical protein